MTDTADTSEPQFVAAPDAEDMNARASAVINAASALLASLTVTIDPQMRQTLNRLMEEQSALVGLTVLFGKAGTMPRVAMVCTNQSGDDPGVVCELSRGGVRHVGGGVH